MATVTTATGIRPIVTATATRPTATVTATRPIATATVIRLTGTAAIIGPTMAATTARMLALRWRGGLPSICPIPGRGSGAGACGREHCRGDFPARSEEHTSELQSHSDLVCRLLLEKKNNIIGVHNLHTKIAELLQVPDAVLKVLSDSKDCALR